MSKYRVKEKYKDLPPSKLITIMVGEKKPFTLDTKPFERVVPASKAGPARKVTIQPATDAQLKKLFELGHVMIEEVPSTSGKPANS